MLKELDDYDWAEVFGEGGGGNCSPIIPQASPPNSDVDAKTFSRKDVKRIIQMEIGENDGPDWIIYGQLKDGRFFCARGGCDYTGWDCQAGNSGNIARTKGDIIRFGLTEDERLRFNITLA